MSLVEKTINAINKNPECGLLKLMRSQFDPSLSLKSFCLTLEVNLTTWVAYHNNPDAFSGVKVPELIKETPDPELLTMVSTAIDHLSKLGWGWFGLFYYEKFMAEYQALSENADLN